MTYVVFFECDLLTVPHIEPLIATNSDDAMAEARSVMSLHFSAIAAHVFVGDARIGTIRPNSRANFESTRQFEVHPKQPRSSESVVSQTRK